MLHDLVYAFRQLKRSPGFVLTAVLTLALGIGANIAIFTLVNSILLRPLPFPRQDRLMRIGPGWQETETGPFPKGWVRALEQHSASFQSISAFGPDTESNVGDTDSTDRIFGAKLMANAFDTLQVHPAAGRFFSPDDAIAGHDPVVVLSYGYWKDRFAANPAAVGQTLRIDGVFRRIIGVMPEGVRFPYADTQFVVPVTFKPGDAFDPWIDFDLRAFGRLKPGVAPAQAQADLRRLHGQLLRLFPWVMPDMWARNMTVIPLLEAQVGSMRPRLLLLFAAVGLILLIATANVANMVLARAAARDREMAIRSALGASRARLLCQILSESVLLGLLSGAAGVAAAQISMRALIRMLPATTPRLADISLDAHVLLFAALASVLTGFLFGLIPALQMASPDLRHSLHSGSRSIAGRADQFRKSTTLVVGQVSLSVMVITAAGLLLHSLWNLSQVDPGFRTDRTVSAEVSLDANACQVPQRCQVFFESLLTRLQGAPGAQGVAVTDSLPLTGRIDNFVFDAEGHPRDPRQPSLLATGRTVSPRYFATLGMSLVRGRLLDAQDSSGTTRAVVVNQHLADHLWPQQDPIGKHIENVSDEIAPAVWANDKASIVVGVVSNAHEGSLAAGFDNEVYLPVTPALRQPSMYVLLRTRATTREAAGELRAAVAAIGPHVPVSHVQTLNEVVGESESGQRSLAILLLAFGGLAVVIGGVGVYSLIAFMVSRRTREIGIRLALGAQRWQILRSVLQQGLLFALAGSCLGLVASVLAGHLLRSFLFAVKPLDPVTFAAVVLLMTALALAAAWIPARRAAHVDPIKMLRME